MGKILQEYSEWHSYIQVHTSDILVHTDTHIRGHMRQLHHLVLTFLFELACAPIARGCFLFYFFPLSLFCFVLLILPQTDSFISYSSLDRHIYATHFPFPFTACYTVIKSHGLKGRVTKPLTGFLSRHLICVKISFCPVHQWGLSCVSSNLDNLMAWLASFFQFHNDRLSCGLVFYFRGTLLW